MFGIQCHLSRRLVPVVAVLLVINACADEPSAPIPGPTASLAPLTNVSIGPSGYAVSGLRMPPGAYSGATAVNDSGHVVGFAWVNNNERAVRWSNDSVVVLGVLPGDTGSLATDINTSGRIVGYSSSPGPYAHAFYFIPGVGMLSLHDASLCEESLASAINSNNLVVGVCRRLDNLLYVAFRWTWNTGLELLDVVDSRALDVNDAGTAVGWRETPDGYRIAHLWWPNGSGSSLGTLGGQRSVATGFAPSGEVVGWSQTADGNDHAFRWTWGTGMQDLGPLHHRTVPRM